MCDGRRTFTCVVASIRTICFASLVATSPRLVASFTSTALGHKLVPVSAAVQGTTLIDQIETCVSSAMSPIDIAEFWLRHFPAR